MLAYFEKIIACSPFFLTIVNKKIPPFDQILGKVVVKCGSNKFL
jgi:hypothetical protein